MRFSLLALLLVLVSCSGEKTGPFRRVAILPIENLASDPAGAVDAAAMRAAIWDGLQAQASLHAVMVRHQRDLPELKAAYVVEGYMAAGRYQLRLNGDAVSCAGSLGDCAPRVVAEIVRALHVQPRAVPSAATLRMLAGQQDGNGFAKAALTDPAFASVWLGWSAEVLAKDGPVAAAAILDRAPMGKMPPFDAARVELRRAELRQDSKGRTDALLKLARLSPADIELQDQAARMATIARDYAAAGQIYDRLISAQPDPRFLNQAAYMAALRRDRPKAERYAAQAQAAAPSDPRFMDTRGDVAYFFRDYASAAGYYEEAAAIDVTFQGGIELWKAAEAARLAADSKRAEALLGRYLDFRARAGARNSLIVQAVWDWRGDNADGAAEKLRRAADSTERGKALFLQALMELNKRNFGAARRIRDELPPESIESAFLKSVIEGSPPPQGLPFPAEAIFALTYYLHGEKQPAADALATARAQMDPLQEGQWKKLDARIQGKTAEGLFPASPDDWLAVLLK